MASRPHSAMPGQDYSLNVKGAMFRSYLQRCPRNRLFPAMTVLVLALGACTRPASIDSLMADAKQYQKRGDAKAAIIQLNNVLQQNPKYAEARYLLGSIYLNIGDNLRAESQLREALNEKYDPKPVLPLLAQALFAQGKFQQVLDETRSSDYGEIALQPQILSLRGHSQISLGKFDDAAQSFEEALKRKPDLTQAMLGKVRLAVQKQDLSVALQLIDKALAADPKNLDGWLMKGDLERSMNRLDAAAAAYGKAFDLNPRDVSANMNMASVAMAAGKFDEARKYVDTMRKAAPDNPIGNYLLGLIEFRQGNLKAANDAVQQVLKRLPNYIPAKALDGAVAYSLGSYDEAEQQLQEVLTLYPDSIYLRKLLAATFLKESKPQQALETLGPLKDASTNDTNLLVLIAQAYYQKGDAAKAKRYFEIAAKKNPESSKVRTGLGLARLATGETDRAIADLESAVAEGNSDAGTFLISSLLSAKQFDIAMGVITRLEKKQPNDPGILNTKGTIFIARKDFPGARRAFERSLELQPGYFPAAMNLAALDLAEKNFQAARTRYEKILDGTPSNVEAMMALAKLDAASGNRPEALTWLERARSLQPKDFAPNYTLAQIFIQERDYSKAISVLQDALSAQPQHPEALNMLGYAQLQAGQTSNAVSTYSKLVSLYPKSARALYGLGVAQSAMGNEAGAIVTLQQTLALQPDFPEAITALVDLEIKAGHTADALKIASQTQLRYPKLAMGFLIEGDVSMSDKKFAQAALAYDKAFRLEKNAALLMRLHQAMRLANRGAAADGLLANWINDHPDDIQVRLYYADAAIKESNYRLAIEQYRYVLQKQPQNLAVFHNLMWCYQQQNDKAKALEVAEQAYKINPDAPTGMVDLAGLLLDKGDNDRAVKLLERARDVAPSVPDTRYFLAKAYVKTGDKDRARKELQQLLLSKDDFAGRADATELFQQLNR